MIEVRGRAAPVGALRVGYLLRMYPRFSQTFVVNEILELERQGLAVHILSLRKPTDGRFQESICRVQAGVDYVPEYFVEARGKTLRAMWSAVRRYPGCCARALWATLRHAGATLADLRQAVLVLDLARKRRLDHVHVHFGTSEATVAYLAHLLGGLSYSLTLHAFDIFRDNVDRALLARKINASRFTVTVSQFNRDFMMRSLPGVDAAKIRVNYNGIDLQRFCPEGARREPNTILSIGRLIEKKGFLDLVRAVGHLREAGMQPRCTIVGEGPDQDVLRTEIRRLGLKAHVKLAGARSQEQVRKMLTEASCFALPCVLAADGNVDALPTVLLEAMACGCPCVSTTVSGVPEIIEHERTGLLVSPGDPQQLAAAMARILTSGEDPGGFGSAGRQRAQRLFDVRCNVGRMLHWFEDLRPAVQREPTAKRAQTEGGVFMEQAA